MKLGERTLGHPVYRWNLTRRLKDRINEHRRAVDKNNIKSKPTTVSEHFLSHCNHSHTDMQLIPLEKIRSSRDSVRKATKGHDSWTSWPEPQWRIIVIHIVFFSFPVFTLYVISTSPF